MLTYDDLASALDSGYALVNKNTLRKKLVRVLEPVLEDYQRVSYELMGVSGHDIWEVLEDNDFYLVKDVTGSLSRVRRYYWSDVLRVGLFIRFDIESEPVEFSFVFMKKDDFDSKYFIRLYDLEYSRIVLAKMRESYAHNEKGVAQVQFSLDPGDNTFYTHYVLDGFYSTHEEWTSYRQVQEYFRQLKSSEATGINL